MTSVAVWVRERRRYFMAVSFALPALVIATYFVLEALLEGGISSRLRTFLLAPFFLVPLHWSGVICSAWFDPNSGTFRQGRAPWLRWSGAAFLFLFALAAVVGPVLVLSL